MRYSLTGLLMIWHQSSYVESDTSVMATYSLIALLIDSCTLMASVTLRFHEMVILEVAICVRWAPRYVVNQVQLTCNWAIMTPEQFLSKKPLDWVYRQYYLARLEFPLIYWAFESAPFINFNCISLGRSAPSWEQINSSLLQAQYLDMASPCACGWRFVCKAFLIFTFSSRATMLYPLVHKPIFQLFMKLELLC